MSNESVSPTNIRPLFKGGDVVKCHIGFPTLTRTLAIKYGFQLGQEFPPEYRNKKYARLNIREVDILGRRFDTKLNRYEYLFLMYNSDASSYFGIGIEIRPLSLLASQMAEIAGDDSVYIYALENDMLEVKGFSLKNLTSEDFFINDRLLIDADLAFVLGKKFRNLMPSGMLHNDHAIANPVQGE